MTDPKRTLRVHHVIGVTLRLLLGVIFVVSAVAKLFSVDQFELYIYSYGFLPLNLSFLLARLCIGAELVLGILLVTGWLRQLTLTVSALLLLAFSLFLGYAALAGRTDSCQCFGQLADMPPTLSLVKNAVLLLLTLLCTKLSSTCHPRRWHCWAAVALVLIGFATPFIISVPDNWMFGPSAERYDEEALRQVLDQMPPEKNIRTGGKVVAFVTPGCPYCRMTRQKLDYMATRHNIASDKIIYIEPSDIGADTFLRTTRGASPLLLLLDDGQVRATFHYRNIEERKIVRTLTSH